MYMYKFNKICMPFSCQSICQFNCQKQPKTLKWLRNTFSSATLVRPWNMEYSLYSVSPQAFPAPGVVVHHILTCSFISLPWKRLGWVVICTGQNAQVAKGHSLLRILSFEDLTSASSLWCLKIHPGHRGESQITVLYFDNCKQTAFFEFMCL